MFKEYPSHPVPCLLPPLHDSVLHHHHHHYHHQFLLSMWEVVWGHQNIAARGMKHCPIIKFILDLIACSLRKQKKSVSYCTCLAKTKLSFCDLCKSTETQSSNQACQMKYQNVIKLMTLNNNCQLLTKHLIKEILF